MHTNNSNGALYRVNTDISKFTSKTLNVLEGLRNHGIMRLYLVNTGGLNDCNGGIAYHRRGSPHTQDDRVDRQGEAQKRRDRRVQAWWARPLASQARSIEGIHRKAEQSNKIIAGRNQHHSVAADWLLQVVQTTNNQPYVRYLYAHFAISHMATSILDNEHRGSRGITTPMKPNHIYYKRNHKPLLLVCLHSGGRA
jgi:hypothetical protein